MDSVLLMSANKTKTAMNHTDLLFHTALKYRYTFSVNGYSTMNDNFFPDFMIESKKIHINEFKEEVFPTIWVYIYEDKNLFERDENFPIAQNGEEYFPVFSLRCREEMFLLEFILSFMIETEGYLLCNVHNRLQTFEELEHYNQVFFRNWAYLV